MEKMMFKEYYETLPEKKKLKLRNQLMPLYIGYSTFYTKMATNAFTPLEFEKLETLTHEKFKRNDDN